MKTTVTKSMFRDAFNACRPDNFSYEGLGAMFDWFEELDGEMEFDIIGICCEFSEYESREQCAEEYCEDITAENLQDHTMLIEFNGGIIIQDF